MNSSVEVAEAVAEYEIVRPIGSGPRGDVYLARRPARLAVDVELVVLKTMRGVSTAATFRRASEDLRCYAAARSPYLVTLYEVGQQAGTFYYAMEHISGGTLLAPADPTQALRAVADAARAAGDLHAAGMVHGGIAPHNILVAAYGAKLAELNLDHVFTPGVVVPVGASAAVEFRDPSLLLGQPPRPHHDVWALGATLHRVAAKVGIYGELPADATAAVRRVRQAVPSISPALPAALADLVRACLAAPADRPSAAEVAERLDRR